MFRTLSTPTPSKDPPPRRAGYLSIRLRRGRGGCAADRSVPARQHPLAAPPIPPPQKYLDWRKISLASSDTTDEGDDDRRKEMQQADAADREWRTTQRFKFDNDAVSADEESRMVIDDYDTR